MGKTKNSLPIVRNLKEAKEKAFEHQEFKTILFSDLCDSTSYKMLRGDVEGVTKTYVHNETITKIIARSDGIVVKYIGDEVMASFEEEKGPQAAVHAAVEIQNALQQDNEKWKRSGIDEIRSKIGIHCGEVLSFKFPGHKIEDPQGKVVDIAARLTALAKPYQILCTQDVKERCDSDRVAYSRAAQRELKGITPPLDVFEVLWQANGREKGINDLAHFSPPNEHIDQLLNNAREAESRENYEEAANYYKGILALDSLLAYPVNAHTH